MEKSVYQRGGLVQKLILAPMVRICTHPFRILALRHGADLVYTEEIIDKKLIGAERVVNEELKTIDFINKNDRAVVLRISEEEKDKLVCQLGSNNPETVVQAAQVVENDVNSIDINMGCPEFFSLHAGMGAGLVRLPEKAKDILTALTETIKIPISCKIRILPKLGDTLDFVKLMQSTGINHLSIHSRIREEMSRGHAHWSVVKAAVEDPEIKIPIRSSGDCFSSNDAFEIINYTNCDSILIARGACHNPAIFEDIKHHWENLSEEEFKSKIEEDLYGEHKKHIDELELEKLVEEEAYESFIPEQKEGMSKSQAKKRAKKMLKKNKKGKTAEKGKDGKQSKTLYKIIEARSKGCKEVDIVKLCQEYMKLAIEYGNRNGNTKYVLNYMLRTHKDSDVVFHKINSSRTMEDMAKALDLGDFYTEQVTERPVLLKHFSDTYYKVKKTKKQKTSEES